MPEDRSRRDKSASEAEWTRRAVGPTIFEYQGGVIGHEHRSWRLLNIGGESRGVVIRFSGSIFDAGHLRPHRIAITASPRFEVLHDENGTYRAKTLVYGAEKTDLKPEWSEDSLNVAWPDLLIPAGYPAATDQTIKRRISVSDVDRAFAAFDEALVGVTLFGNWELAEGEFLMEVLVGEELHCAYSQQSNV